MAKNVEECDHLKILSHFKYITITATSFSEDLTSSIGSESSSEPFDDNNDDDDDYASSSSVSTCSSSETRPDHGDSGAVQPKHETKRGLSRYYQGKARTFESLSDVKCVGDLAKKEIPFVKRGRGKSIIHRRITC